MKLFNPSSIKIITLFYNNLCEIFGQYIYKIYKSLIYITIKILNLRFFFLQRERFFMLLFGVCAYGADGAIQIHGPTTTHSNAAALSAKPA